MKIFTKRSKYQSGLTVMEILIYLSILILSTAIIVRVMAGTFGMFAKSRAIRGITVTGSALMERIVYNIRNAESYSVTGNSLGVNPSTLSIVVPDSSGIDHTYVYTVTNNRLTETIDGASAEYLHPANQTITTFRIDQITAGSYSGALITLVLQDGRVSPAETATFTTTTMMRGTY
jgi:hypothetical protein